MAERSGMDSGRKVKIMARISDMKMKYRIFMKTYKYRSVAWRPGTSLDKPLRESRIALVSTAALQGPGQQDFDLDLPGGDPSYRILSAGTYLGSLPAAHPSGSFDHSGIDSDINLAFPLDRLRELAGEGYIGSIASRHFSFMGAIVSPEKLIEETAPEVAELLIEDRADGVLLVPV